MRVFLTGASGWVGSAVVPELLNAGHDVVGLARTTATAERLVAAGVAPVAGDLTDLESLRAGARGADAVIHLAYDHDFSRMGAAGEVDRAALRAFAEEFGGTEVPVIFASGLLGLPTHRVATEDDLLDADSWLPPRHKAELLSKQLAEQTGVRTSVIRMAPTVHGAGGDWGFITSYVESAIERGVAAFVEDGSHHWPAVHRSDAASLFRTAIENPGPGGSVLHACAENVPFKQISEAVARQLDVPLKRIEPEEATEHFGPAGPFFTLGAVVSSDATQARYGWKPVGPSLLQDIDDGVYTPAPGI
ncbi:SDR family oxidoreductase [Nocardioides sp. QY071]|uniref:SDR family oxidoreductase n=1 Tax=Nocardioides sp. QY071 TaxID=3044187 RepID=UPI00249BF28E|nr:SDR family oxidoreductase [Nocardioides sp. QY071]WGY00476.1 SDR family oxidoreductase [Nocardioides sp. QY071]